MAMMNIPSTVDDPSYRYKMPRLSSRTESRGNGVKTNVVNCSEIAGALRRPPEYLTKFFGNELGAQATWAVKDKGQPQQCIIMGRHEQNDLQLLVDRFIETFVLCPKCNLPEADIHIKSKDIHGKCKACGFSGVMPHASVHKMATYVVKNPPGADCSQEAGADASAKGPIDKKARREARAEKQRQLAAAGGGPEEAAEEASGSEPVEKKKKKKKDKEEDGEKKKKKKKDKDESGEKKKKKKKDKEASEEEDNSDDEDGERFTIAIAKLREHAEAPADVFFAALRERQVAEGYDAATRAYVALEALFGEAAPGEPLTDATLAKKLPQVQASVNSFATQVVLQALEKYLEAHSEAKLAKVCHELYKADVLDDAGVLGRYRAGNGGGAGHTLLKTQLEASGFLDWLEESDDDSSEEESD